jgi:predicted Zn-dependent protease
MIYLYWSAGARDASDGRTVFSRPGGGTRVGDRLTSTGLTLRSDPGAASVFAPPFVIAHESSAASSVFDNGLALAPTEWIADGVLSSLVQTRRTAAVTDLPVTPYIDNLILDGSTTSAGSARARGASGEQAGGKQPGGARSGGERTDGGGAGGAGGLGDLIGRTERGLLLTCLWYIREVDPRTLLLTGLTRDGVYLVERGEVVGSVNNFRFNESPVDLLARVGEAGAPVRTLPREWCDYFTRTVMPPLRVADFNMSSVSQAS